MTRVIPEELPRAKVAAGEEVVVVDRDWVEVGGGRLVVLHQMDRAKERMYSTGGWRLRWEVVGLGR